MELTNREVLLEGQVHELTATVARLERELSELTAQIDGHRCGDVNNFAKTMQVAMVDGEGRLGDSFASRLTPCRAQRTV